MSIAMTSGLVREILNRANDFTWTVQGFGFLRTKIQNVGRIHVWDSRLAVPGVSTMHTHPWSFKSTIISGELMNARYVMTIDGQMLYQSSIIQTGEGGGLIGDQLPVRVNCAGVDHYSAGDSYTQEANDIHRSIAMDGTVTLLERQQGPADEKAHVFWPYGTTWISAEPRPAQEYEITSAVSAAIMRWRA